MAPKRTIRRIISKCHNCFRSNPTPVQPLMGDLPPSRLTAVKAFAHDVVDYAGSFSITSSRVRGTKVLKAYVCLFICMATKALHIELASDMSSAAFLAALRRFIAQRGRVNHIYSDQGRNFTGAWKEISSFMHLASQEEKIEWHFNPPYAPNFGGLWEAGVKSVKTHLVRVIGLQTLTFEELNTVLIQIEGVVAGGTYVLAVCPPSNL